MAGEIRYGFNLSQIEGLDSSVQTVTLTIANATESNTYTLNRVTGFPLTWRDNPDPELSVVYIRQTLSGAAELYNGAFTNRDVGDTYNVTISTSAVEENFKSAVETVLADNGLISEPETIFDETLTLTDDILYYELPSDFPDGWYENAVCTVNGMEIPKDPESPSSAPLFTLSTDTINVDVGYRPSMDGHPAQLEFSYYDVPNDAIIPGDYQVKIVAQARGGGDSADNVIIFTLDEATGNYSCNKTLADIVRDGAINGIYQVAVMTNYDIAWLPLISYDDRHSQLVCTGVPNDTGSIFQYRLNSDGSVQVVSGSTNLTVQWNT